MTTSMGKLSKICKKYARNAIALRFGKITKKKVERAFLEGFSPIMWDLVEIRRIYENPLISKGDGHLMGEFGK